MLNMLVTLTKEGTVQVWRVRVNQDPNKPHMRANFLEPAGTYYVFSSVTFDVPRKSDVLKNYGHQ